jgi:hypothetical protein
MMLRAITLKGIMNRVIVIGKERKSVSATLPKTDMMTLLIVEDLALRETK